MIEITVDGTPKAQKRPRFVRAGKGVRVYDPSAKEKKAFRKECLADAPIDPIEGAVSIQVEFVMPRPKYHYGTGKNSDEVKASSPEEHTVKPDTDNMIKFLMDALNGLYWKDDCVIDEIIARKRWGKEGYTKMLIVEPEDDIGF